MTNQELIEKWKQEQAQSQTVTQQIPNIAMYQAQNEARRDYGNIPSALAIEAANKAFLAQNPVVQNATTQNEVSTPMQQIDFSDYPLPTSPSDSFRAEVEAKLAQDDKISKWLDPNYKLSKEEVAEARRVAREGIERLQKNNTIGNAPVYVGRSFKEMSPQEQEEYLRYKDLDYKTNPVVSFALGAGDQAMKIGKSIKFLGDKGYLGPVQMAAQKLTNPLTDKIIETYDRGAEDLIPSITTQNPLATGAGRFATNAAAYAVTNPAFDALGASAGLKGLGAFAANQAAQAVQDVALDILPTYQEMTKDGPITDDEVKELAQQFGWDVVGNLAFGVGGELLKKFNNARQVAKETQAANQAFANTISEGANKLARLNAEGYQPPAKYTSNEIAGLNVNPVEANNNQFNALMNEFNNEFKDTSAMRNIYNPEDLDNAMNNQLRQLMDDYKVPEMENPKVEMEAPDIPSVDDYSKMWETPKTDSIIPNIAENTQKSASNTEIPEIKNVAKEAKQQRLDLPEDVKEKAASDFSEIFDSLEKMRQKAETTGDPKVIEKFDRLDKALTDYENAFFYNESEEALTSAKKASDAARQAFIRQVKKVDPNYTAELTGTKLGNAAYRRTSMKASEEAAQELADSIIEADNMLNTNRWAKDAAPETQKVFKGVEGANPLQTFAGDTPSFEEQMKTLTRRQLEARIETNNELKQRILNGTLEEGNNYAQNGGVTGTASYGDVDAAIRRIDGENAYYQKQLDSLKSAEEKEDESLDALTNYVNSQRNAAEPPEPPKNNTSMSEEPVRPRTNTSNNPPSPPDNTPPRSAGDDEWKISKARTNTFERRGYGDAMPRRDYAYRVFSEAEQKAAAVERYADVENATKELLNKDYGDFDEVDVKEAFGELQRLIDQGDEASARLANRLGKKTAAVQREGGRIVQASAEYTRNTAAGAMEDAWRVQENRVNNWQSRNRRQAEGNSRIAKALADMGHKPNNKIRPELTHDQIKKGVIAEIEREVGSVENHFNENDIEFLTQLAEDKSIPVWKITSEIEHKLKTGQWYSLDESVEIPKPTNANLQNALASLVNNEVRAPKEPKTLKQIAEEVKNTFAKESAGYESNFTDDEMEYIANLIHEGASKEELADALNTKMATGTFGVSPETMQKVNGIFKEIQNYDPDSKRFVEGQAEAYRLLANEVLGDATALEKFEAWRYMAMLGNPKTMIRNFVGNQMFGLVTGISNNLAALGEAGVDKASKALGGNGIQRTKAILNPIADSNLIKAAAEDADLSKYRQVMGSKYEKFSSDTLRRNKSVFNTKLAQLYEKAVDAGISDYKAVKNKYSTSLAGYMKANGLDSSAFDASYKYQDLMNQSKSRLLSDAERSQMDSLKTVADKLEKGREYALRQAEYATFHEDNKIADVLSKWSRTSKEEGTGIGHVLIEGTVPFKKTPANVLRSGLEYSPLGAIDSIKKTGKLIYENTGKRAGNLADTYINRAGKEVQKTLANDVIESWSKTLTGTGLTALGFYLYDKGILNSSDKDTKYQDSLEGLQNYSITIGDKTYTVDWAAPAVMPLLLGAEIAKVWNSSGNEVEHWYDHLDEYLNAANRIADPIIETSMLSGVKDTLETAANSAKYDENLNIPALAIYNMGTGYLSQAVPTISGQIARTVDNTRRSTYTDKEGVAGILEKQGRKMMNKIPGLSTLNQPYVDTYGREQKNGPTDNPLINFGYQAISPGYLQSINQTNADKMSREVYENDGTNNTGILPQWKSYFKEDGKRVSPEEYTTAAKAYGNAEYEIRDKLANDEWFKSLDSAEQTEIVKGINGIAEHVGAASIDPEYETSAKAYNAYKEGGIDGLIDYYKSEHSKDIAKGLANEAGVSTSTNAYKDAQALVAEGKEDEAKKVLDDAAKTKEILDKYELGSTSNAGKEVKAAVEAGNVRQAEQIAKQAAAEKEAKAKKAEEKEQAQASGDDLSSYGLTKQSATSTYEKAKNTIPGLSTQQFATTYKQIDSNGNQGITQDEVIDYLNKYVTSDAKGQEIWTAYGSSNWKKIPVLKNGKWTKGKK